MMKGISQIAALFCCLVLLNNASASEVHIPSKAQCIGIDKKIVQNVHTNKHENRLYARCVLDGVLVNHDKSKALSYMGKCSSSTDFYCVFSEGIRLKYLADLDTRESNTASYKYFVQAYTEGRVPSAAKEIGLSYIEGMIDGKDYVKAMAWLWVASELGAKSRYIPELENYLSDSAKNKASQLKAEIQKL